MYNSPIINCVCQVPSFTYLCMHCSPSPKRRARGESVLFAGRVIVRDRENDPAINNESFSLTFSPPSLPVLHFVIVAMLHCLSPLFDSAIAQREAIVRNAASKAKTSRAARAG